MKLSICLTVSALAWVNLSLSLPTGNGASLSEGNPEEDTVGPAVYGIYQVYKTYGPPAEAAAESLEKRQPVEDTVGPVPYGVYVNYNKYGRSAEAEAASLASRDAPTPDYDRNPYTTYSSYQGYANYRHYVEDALRGIGKHFNSLKAWWMKGGSNVKENKQSTRTS